MHHNTADIRIYSQPPPIGKPPVSHNRKWRQVFTVEWQHGPAYIASAPKQFCEQALMTVAQINSRYNTKRHRVMEFKSR